MFNYLTTTFLIIIRNRFVIFFLFLLAFGAANYAFTGAYLPTAETKNLWFYSGLFMVLFSILFIEPYYTSPKNVITNVIPLLLVFLAIGDSFDNKVFWWATIWILLLLLLISIVAMSLYNSEKSPANWQNRASDIMRRSVVLVGQGKVLYSVVFIYFLLAYHSIQDFYTLVLFSIWFLILALNPKQIQNTFSIINNNYDTDAIGEIFGVQSKKIFLAKLFEDRMNVKKFEILQFRYSMQDSADYAITGIVFDTYLLNQEKWVKILQLGSLKKNKNENRGKNIVYKVADDAIRSRLEKELNVNNLVGVIIEDSRIGKIKFEYSKKQDDIQEGDLLELKIGEKRLFYQVVTGVTENERLEARNESGFIEGEAIQLGEWNNDKLSFQKFGWVPSINTPVFKAKTTDIETPSYEYPDYKLGTIPNTTLPSVINLREAVSHHTALLGVTGSGKSFLAQKIIEELKVDTKIICVDFTGEWKKELTLDTEDFTTIADSMTNDKISLIELSSVSNTTESLEETNSKLQEIFTYAKENPDSKRICLVLEEAHTIVPETTFLGDYGDYSANKALVNKMSQIALQGRKFGVGLLVLAQRTANVSKTVLTQCNTVICFQAFDETSFNFLSNYLGKDLVSALPDLKEYHAVVTGKAIRANIPMIVDLRREIESSDELTLANNDENGQPAIDPLEI